MSARTTVAAIAVTLAAAGAAIAGHAIGSHTGPDLAAARADGARQARLAGTMRGTGEGRKQGLRTGRQATYHAAYQHAYGVAYSKALRKQPATAAKTTPVAAPPPPTDCPGVGGATISGVSVRKMTCGQAQGVIDTMGAISAHFTVLGFTCDRLSGGDLGGQWRCTRGVQALRFDFAD
jgi:hypothetical protein